MAQRFFVTITSPNKRALVNLGKHEFDLFYTMARATDDKQFMVDGLLTLEEIGYIVEEGYRVLVEKEALAVCQIAREEVIDFQDWLKGMESETTPPTGYLKAEGIETVLEYLANTYPSICHLIELPERSAEPQGSPPQGRLCRAILIARPSNTYRRGVLFLGGIHARELVNPDMLVSLAFNLCRAYTTGNGLTFGGKSYDAATIKLIIDALDIFIFPLVNPDGRAFVQAADGDCWWRKNRNPTPNLPCEGVDVNRNFDFLWSSVIGGTSSNPCDPMQRFFGTAAFSEPETRNVRYLLDTYPNITCMIDLHSAGQWILHPWGDDDNQIDDPEMNFLNPNFNGKRGIAGDTLYREYIPEWDLDLFKKVGNDMRDAIAAVRGTDYKVGQASEFIPPLYTTSGTAKDYAFSRNFVDSSKHKVYAYTFETGQVFHHPYVEALNIISEVSAGLIQFCLSCLCMVEESVQLVIEDFGYDAGGWRVGRHPRFLTDLTGDGRADIVGFGDAGVWTALNHCAGTFQEPRFVLADLGYVAGGWRVGKHPRFLADLNGDGRADIVGFGDAGVWTALSNGDGTFQELRFVLADLGYSAGGWRVQKHPRFLADLTGDGCADIVGFGDAGVWIALSNGDGTFQEPRLVIANFGYNQGWRVTKHPRFLADLTGDGRADIIGFGTDHVIVSMNNGDGTFQPPKKVLTAFTYEDEWRVEKHPRCLADLTGDGRADIIGFGTDHVIVSMNNGDGTFQSPKKVLTTFTYEDEWRVEKHPRFLADLTGDGRADIIGFGTDHVIVSLNNGDGTFQPPQKVLTTFTYEDEWRVEKHPRFLADLTGDGRADIVGFGYDGVFIRVL